MTGETVQYSPDGKGGFVGVTDSAPGAGDTILYSPDGVAAGGGSPGVGDTITYSADGKGGYIGGVGGVKGLWFWACRGVPPTSWQPWGSEPVEDAFWKMLVKSKYRGGHPKIRMVGRVPHIFYWELNQGQTIEEDELTFFHVYLNKAWNLPGAEWIEELFRFAPEGQWFLRNIPELKWYWDVRIGQDGRIHLVISQGGYYLNQVRKIVYYYQDPGEEWSPMETVWTSPEDYTYFDFAVTMDLDLSGNPHVSFCDPDNPPYNYSTKKQGSIREATRSGGVWSDIFVTHWGYTQTVYPYYWERKVHPILRFVPGTNNRHIAVTANFGYQWYGYFDKDWYCPFTYKNLGAGWVPESESPGGIQGIGIRTDLAAREDGSVVVQAYRYTENMGRNYYFSFNIPDFEYGGWYFDEFDGINEREYTDVPCLQRGAYEWDPVQQQLVLKDSIMQFLSKQDNVMRYMYCDFRTWEEDPFAIPYIFELATKVIYCDMDLSISQYLPSYQPCFAVVRG
jgi:hypothetical protein